MNLTDSTAPASATATTSGPITVTTIKHTESIKTIALDQFPNIEVGHTMEATRGPRNKNWKLFFANLPVGGVFYVKSVKEAQTYYMAGYMRDIKLSRKRQPGGTIKMQRRSAD